MARTMDYDRYYRATVTNSPNPKGFRETIEKPKARHAVTAHNEYCQHISLVDGELLRCMEPTQGRTYCPSCAMHLITLTDRVPAQPSQTEPVNWRAQGPTRDKRKRKAA